jgi:hypothetical protein
MANFRLNRPLTSRKRKVRADPNDPFYQPDAVKKKDEEEENGKDDKDESNWMNMTVDLHVPNVHLLGMDPSYIYTQEQQQ